MERSARVAAIDLEIREELELFGNVSKGERALGGDMEWLMAVSENVTANIKDKQKERNLILEDEAFSEALGENAAPH